jgi:hypothetical protein
MASLGALASAHVYTAHLCHGLLRPPPLRADELDHGADFLRREFARL